MRRLHFWLGRSKNIDRCRRCDLERDTSTDDGRYRRYRWHPAQEWFWWAGTPNCPTSKAAALRLRS